jgi:flotillin
VLLAKAEGYKQLMAVFEDRKDLAPALLVLEQLPQLISEQVKAIRNLKIDKITVWDSGNQGGGDTTTAGFLEGMIGALPPAHELAAQAGIDLPEVLGRGANISKSEPRSETPDTAHPEAELKTSAPAGSAPTAPSNRG